MTGMEGARAAVDTLAAEKFSEEGYYGWAVREAVPDFIDTFISELQRAGYAIVPREPTDAMAKAGMMERLMQDRAEASGQMAKDTNAVYAAMIEAALKDNGAEGKG